MVINRKANLYLLALPMGLMGFTQLVFAVLSMLVFRDHEIDHFLLPAIPMVLVAALLLTFARGFDFSRIGFRDALFFATMTWVAMGFFGALPIMLVADVSLADGVFEALSGLTTTGATILTGLDAMPRSFLLYRQFLQWMGGLGVVIFVVSVLPLLNAGGMRLLKAEMPGPIKSDKVAPRVATTAQYLWLVYIAITAACALCFVLAGMSPYEAVAHSFATVATGGFSTHDASIGYFASEPVLLVADVFMLLGAMNFALHFRVARAGRPAMYWRDEETRVFLLIVLVMSLIIAALLVQDGAVGSWATALNQSVFHLISFITTTGFVAAPYTDWPLAVALLLVIAGYMGGCSGSTAGGNKIIRSILSVKMMGHEMKRLVHPDGVFTVKYQGRPMDIEALSSTIAFMSVAIGVNLLLTLAVMATGLDFWSALTGVAACVNVMGPAFGVLGANFQPLSDTGTWLMSLAMVVGRLEYFTVLALVMPRFWRD